MQATPTLPMPFPSLLLRLALPALCIPLCAIVLCCLCAAASDFSFCSSTLANFAFMCESTCAFIAAAGLAAAEAAAAGLAGEAAGFGADMAVERQRSGGESGSGDAMQTSVGRLCCGCVCQICRQSDREGGRWTMQRAVWEQCCERGGCGVRRVVRGRRLCARRGRQSSAVLWQQHKPQRRHVKTIVCPQHN